MVLPDDATLEADNTVPKKPVDAIPAVRAAVIADDAVDAMDTAAVAPETTVLPVTAVLPVIAALASA